MSLVTIYSTDKFYKPAISWNQLDNPFYKFVYDLLLLGLIVALITKRSTFESIKSSSSATYVLRYILYILYKLVISWNQLDNPFDKVVYDLLLPGLLDYNDYQTPFIQINQKWLTRLLWYYIFYPQIL